MPKLHTSLATVFLVILLAFLGPWSCRRSSFSLLTLGAYGGGRDGNLTSFALRLQNRQEYRVLLDAGSLFRGLEKHLGDEDFAKVEAFFLGFDNLFLTHSHLDHLTGFVTFSPSLFKRDAPMVIRSHPRTASTVLKHVFQSELWADFESLGAVRFRPFDLGELVKEAGMRFRLLPLTHPVPSFGFLIEAPDGAAFVHLGDTGPTRAYHPLVRPVLESGHLRALSMECSFESGQKELALLSGHMTPDLLLRHLVDLVTGTDFPPGAEIPPQSLDRTVKALASVRLIIQHIKPESEKAIRKELEILSQLGLDLVIPRQGEELQF
jgi:3',5'-cyclic-nucleotide phosphodiesterase